MDLICYPTTIGQFLCFLAYENLGLLQFQHYYLYTHSNRPQVSTYFSHTCTQVMHLTCSKVMHMWLKCYWLRSLSNRTKAQHHVIFL